VPLLDRKVGEFSKQYINDLKKKWHTMGPRAIFDPPGLHRSANLSALSYNAFFEEWKKRFPLDPAYSDVVSDELSSLSFSFDKLPSYQPRLPNGPNGEPILDAPVKFKTGFEDLKLPKPEKSLAALLDKEAKLPPLTKEDITITTDEWKQVAERQAEYRALHGDPMLEAEEDDFARSERFFVQSESSDSKLAPKKVDFSDFTFMNEDETESDWDGDTYDATAAVLGTPEEQAFERSKTQDKGQGDESLTPPKNKRAPSMALDEAAAEARARSKAKEAAQASAGHAVARTSGAQEGYAETSPEDASLEDDTTTLEPEEAGRRTEVNAESEFWEGVKPKGEIGSGPSGKAPQETPAGTEQAADPYQHNPEEDDEFPEKKPTKSISRDKHTSDEQIEARQRPKYRHGRLHDDPWHDDFR